jgi:ABC-2 type transport system ATP-binding protein
MSPVVTVIDLSRRFGDTTALDGVSFALSENTIYGLLGRNGAGKTTLMRILAGHDFATSGQARVLGADPFENEAVLSRLCFVKESQKYPDNFRVRHVLRAASLLFPNWDEEFAGSLVEAFQLRVRPAVKKLSRGMLSALGIVVGLASRSADLLRRALPRARPGRPAHLL